MANSRLENILNRIGLLDTASLVFNTILRYQNGSTLTAEVDGLTAAFCTESTPEYAHMRNFWMDDLGSEGEVLKQFLSDLKKNDVVFDIGANVGIYTCFAQQLVTDGYVHAFEPHPQNATRLADNIYETGDKKVTEIHRVAISDESGSISLSIGGEVTGKGTHNIVGNGEQTVTVKTDRLDDYIEANGLLYPDVLKIDVEGAEECVLLGASNALQHARLVYIEVHPQHNTSLTSVRKTLESAGFDIEFLTGRGEQPFLRAAH